MRHFSASSASYTLCIEEEEQSEGQMRGVDGDENAIVGSRPIHMSWTYQMGIVRLG